MGCWDGYQTLVVLRKAGIEGAGGGGGDNDDRPLLVAG